MQTSAFHALSCVKIFSSQNELYKPKDCYPKPKKKKQPEARRICLNDETTRSELVDHSEIKVLSQVKIPGSM